jgi:N-glycosylase/DNA lyase
MPAPLPWSDWQPLALSPSKGFPLPEPLAPAVLAEVLDGGQAFRWHRVINGAMPPALRSLGEAGPSPDTAMVWQGVWSDCVARLKPGADGGPLWSAPQTLAGAVAGELPRYLAASVNFTQLADGLPWRSDPHLARCLAAFPGLRLLRQPLGETLLGFLCSSTKQIAQIRQMIELLARRHGREIAPGISRLPTWAELAGVNEEDLRACLLGFRARYVKQTAQFLAEHAGWLEQIERLPYAEAKARLRELPGVGEKIADCVLLFGAGRLEAFPVDVWILKAMGTRYGLDGWTPQQVAHFGRMHFGPHAGLAQQYLFAWERAHRRD